MRGLGTIFSFTFSQHIRRKGYKNATILITILCFLLPALILPAIEYFAKDDNYQCRAEKIYVVDTDTEHPVDYRILNQLAGEKVGNLTYETAGDVETAVTRASEEENSLLLVVEKEENQYQANVILPTGSSLGEKDADAYEAFISQNFRYILVQKSGLEAEQITEITAPIQVTSRSFSKGMGEGKTEETDEYAAAKNGFGMVLPYLNIMILYFMILAYGQGTANAAIMEKTSKLMDLFLISVKPRAMLLGKVLATTLSGIVQLFCWIGGLAGGVALGTFLVKTINPQTDMALIQLFDAFGQVSGMFTLSGVLLALLMLAAGLLLYCALAAIGGALAGKPEDLSNTNMVFVMVLIVSFFATMYAGGGDAPWQVGNTWHIWVPFTAILTVPTKILLGSVTIPQALASLGIVIVTAVAVTILAGRIYQLMSLYKGNPPTPKKLWKMMKGK